MATPNPRRSRKKSASTDVSARIVHDNDSANGARRELLAAKVLDKAAVLFASQGFAATSLKDVADAVGLKRSSIYYYYPDKDALLKELVQGVTLPVTQLFLDIEKEELPPLLRYVKWCGALSFGLRILVRISG